MMQDCGLHQLLILRYLTSSEESRDRKAAAVVDIFARQLKEKGDVLEFTQGLVEQHEVKIGRVEDATSKLASLAISEGHDPQTAKRLTALENGLAAHALLLAEDERGTEPRREERGGGGDGGANRGARKVEKLENDMRRTDRRMESLEHTLALRNVNMSDLEETLRAREFSSYNGQYTWKIDNFTSRRHEAVSGKQLSCYSPCFFTGVFGYKMCARIYLNGDGMGRETHISIFFVIMRGQYDALLRWPFRQKVTFMLLDQNNEEHVIDAFRPDPSSSSFQRPRKDTNIASGCPMFCSLAELSSHGYVKDDVMFIKIIVDTNDL